MWIARLNGLLSVLFVLSLGLAVAPVRDRSTPNAEFLPDMAHSIPYDAFDPNAQFPDGKTLRTPPEGTIQRGALPVHRYDPTPEGAKRAGEELKNPVMRDEAVLARGGELYRNFCMVCHGAEGRGDGPVTKRGYPPPPSILLGDPVARRDGEYFHVLTYGQGNMPGYAPQLDPSERWEIIHYVRSLQEKEAQKGKGTK